MSQPDHDFDLIVIGSGAGGLTAAKTAARLGKSVAVVEKGAIGGDCLNYACVPTKSLLHVAETFDTVKAARAYGVTMAWPRIDLRRVHRWKQSVVTRATVGHNVNDLAAAGIELLEGEAKFISHHEVRVGKRHYVGRFFLIATGAHICVPPIMGLEKTGYMTYMQAGEMDAAPKSVIIIGCGPVGVEYAFIYRALGISVTAIEGCERIILNEDREATGLVESLMIERGVKLHLNAIVKHVYRRGGKKFALILSGDEEKTVSADEILIATGMEPNIDLDLEKAGVAFDKHGIRVNDFLQTSQKHIFAAGDVVGPVKLTSTAEYQSQAAVVNMFGQTKVKIDYRVAPRCLFVDPEMAAVGTTEQALIEQKVPYRVGRAELKDIPRAVSDSWDTGFAKVLVNSTGAILGAVIVAPRAGEMIHELALAMKVGATVGDIADLIHAYPTYSELVKLACASAR